MFHTRIIRSIAIIATASGVAVAGTALLAQNPVQPAVSPFPKRTGPKKAIANEVEIDPHANEKAG